MKNYTTSTPVFSENIEIVETTDSAHADNVNAAPKQLLQNTLFNRDQISKLSVGLNECVNIEEVIKAIDEAYTQFTGYVNLKISELINGAPSTRDTLKEISDAMDEHQDVVQALHEAIGSKANENEFESHRINNNIHVTTTEKQQIQAHGNFIQDFINLFPGVADHKKATYQLGGGLDGGMIAPIYTAEEDCLVILNGFIQYLSPPNNATIAGNLLINNTTVLATTLVGKETGINAPLAAFLRLKKGDCVNVQLLCTGLSKEIGTMVNIHYFLKTLSIGVTKSEMT